MTPLEEALATRTIGHSFFSLSTPQHIITRLASYIYHHDNTDVPVAAVQLLTRLASVSISVLFHYALNSLYYRLLQCQCFHALVKRHLH